MAASRNSYLVRYFVYTYLVFWALLGITGALIALKTPPLVQTIMQNVCAWSPTFVIIMLFRKLYPNTTVAEYLRRNFLSKVNPLTFLLTLLIQALIVALAVTAYLLSTNAAESSLSFADLSTLPSIILITVTSGPIGEELGWRGYALGEMQRRVSPFTAALILGAVWGFWHTPLWMLSGYSGMKLAYYIIFGSTGSRVGQVAKFDKVLGMRLSPPR
jgi:membrane protease YdiL (CAAX protease family)